MIHIIAARGRDGSIGRGGDLAFHISSDLRRFKALTMGHTVVMGRRTFESLPKGALPGRRNIVVTRQSHYTAPGIETAGSLEAALALAATAPPSDCDADSEVFIIGGVQIYAQAMPLAAQLCLTEIDADLPDADTFFPAVSASEWAVAETSQPETDPRSGLSYRFVCYIRK